MKKYLLYLLLSATMLSLYSNEQIDIAVELISSRMYDDAFFHINQIIAEYPNSNESREARILLGLLNLQRGYYQEARMQLMILLRNPFLLSPNQRIRIYYNLGLIFYYESNYENAIESFDRLFLDYRNSDEAISALPYYFDSYFKLNDYQSVIIKSREMMRNYTDSEQQAELLYQQARAYFVGNMLQQANQIIQDINTRYPQTMAAWKTTELQVSIHEREYGKISAINMLENLLEGAVSRQSEEKLAWLLVQYYLDEDRHNDAKETLNFILNKYNLSEDLSKYHLAWMKLLIEIKDIQPIFEREEFILQTSLHSDEYLEILYYLSSAYTIIQDYWKAREYLDLITTSTPLTEGGRGEFSVSSENILYSSLLLYADIYILQGQLVNGIELYNRLLTNYSHLGRNYDILMKLGHLYLNHYKQEGLALNFFRQAITLANNNEQIVQAMQMVAFCLESTGQFSEALFTLNQIPKENITDITMREELERKISLLHIFYHTDLATAMSKYITFNQQKQDSVVSLAAILALDFKRFDDALDLLISGNTYETRMERIKLYLLFSYRAILQDNISESYRYTQLIDAEIRQLGQNISSNDRNMINFFQRLITNRGKVTSELAAMSVSQPSTAGINFNNFFNFLLWKHFYDNNDTSNMIAIADSIVQDAFVSNIDYQLVQVLLGSYYFNDEIYDKAIDSFEKAPRFLTLTHSEFLFQYAMSMYRFFQTDSPDQVQIALEILQRLVLNNIENKNLNDAKNLVISQWINTNRLQDALDILNQMPLVLRTDEDYRFLVNIYNLQDLKQQEKDAILHVQIKTMNEYQRLATLHYLTGDNAMAEYTFREILKVTTHPNFMLNAYENLGNMSYLDNNYRDAVTNYEEFFKVLNETNYQAVYETQNYPTIGTAAKHLIISYYMIDNRPRAELTQKNLNSYINKQTEILAEIQLYEGIYYAKMEPRRALRPLNNVIDDITTPAEIAYKAMFHRALLHIQDNKLELAEIDLMTALNTEDDNLRNQVMLTLGNLHHNQENHEDALLFYYQVIVNDEDGDLAKDAAHNFAIAAKHLSDWNTAISAYKIIMDRWGQNALNHQTRLTIGFSFYQAREYDQALLLLNQLLPELTVNDMRAEAQYWISESYAGKQNYDVAIEEFRVLRTNYPRETRWTALSELRIAELYYEQGDMNTAMAMFREILRVHGPASDIGREANKYLQ